MLSTLKENQGKEVTFGSLQRSDSFLLDNVPHIKSSDDTAVNLSNVTRITLSPDTLVVVKGLVEIAFESLGVSNG